MFVEAKLVSPKHPMGYYVSTGLQRFLNGDYAWAMPQAMLLGYCRATSQVLPDSLADHFARESGRKAQELAVIRGRRRSRNRASNRACTGPATADPRPCRQAATRLATFVSITCGWTFTPESRTA